jgi:DNA-3-methyladenine glycosylase
VITRPFFQRDPLTCARELIGCELVWRECAGIIVETEAYAAVDDEACHTFLRRAAREFISEHSAGTAYVYMNYGVHWLLNVLIKDGAADGFVLIRAVEPVRGIESMEVRRGKSARRDLCSGPGKLAQAFGISGSDHGRDLCAGEAIGFRERTRAVGVVSDVRIGITRAAHFPWRFLLEGSPFVSVPHTASRRPRRSEIR